MGTTFPDVFPTPHPGQPAGVGTFVPGHPYATSGPFNGHATLADDLVSYWALDEESGTRYDSVGSNDLQDNNTVGFEAVAGPPNFPGGKAASFVAANDESLTRAYASLVDWPQADFHIAGWVNVADGNVAGGWICRRGGGVGLNDWRILFIGTNERLYLSATTDGTNETLLANSGAGSAPLNQWLFLEVRRSGTTLGIAVNGGAFADVTQSPIPNGTSPLVIGNINSGGVAGFTPTAQYGPIMLWSRVLTVQERTDLYNSGDGLFY